MKYGIGVRASSQFMGSVLQETIWSSSPVNGLGPPCCVGVRAGVQAGAKARAKRAPGQRATAIADDGYLSSQPTVGTENGRQTGFSKPGGGADLARRGRGGYPPPAAAEHFCKMCQHLTETFTNVRKKCLASIDTKASIGTKASIDTNAYLWQTSPPGGGYLQ